MPQPFLRSNYNVVFGLCKKKVATKQGFYSIEYIYMTI